MKDDKVRSCSQKKQFKYRGIAQSFLRNMERNDICEGHAIYKCHYGDHWHIGRKKMRYQKRNFAELESQDEMVIIRCFRERGSWLYKVYKCLDDSSRGQIIKIFYNDNRLLKAKTGMMPWSVFCQRL